jgi:hypothetical protein
MFVSIPPQIRVLAMLLFLTRELILSVDVTFKSMTFLYRDSPSVTSTDEVSEPTQAVRQYK